MRGVGARLGGSFAAHRSSMAIEAHILVESGPDGGRSLTIRAVDGWMAEVSRVSADLDQEGALISIFPVLVGWGGIACQPQLLTIRRDAHARLIVTAVDSVRTRLAVLREPTSVRNALSFARSWFRVEARGSALPTLEFLSADDEEGF
jgi:hypothetical protein